MSNGNGHRWSKFWWQDWQNDQQLKLCSLAAQGLWMRMLCIMHEAGGYLLVAGETPTDAELAAIVGAHWREVRKLLAELERRHVFSKNAAGILHSRRMLKDIEASKTGQKFAEMRYNQKDSTVRPNGSPSESPTGPPNGNPNARSLEAEAEEERKEEAPLRGVAGAQAHPPPRARAAARKKIDPNWKPEADGLACAAEHGVNLDTAVPQFVDYHIANGNLRVDWPAAWRTWCRNEPTFRRKPTTTSRQSPQERHWEAVLNVARKYAS